MSNELMINEDIFVRKRMDCLMCLHFWEIIISKINDRDYNLILTYELKISKLAKIYMINYFTY